MRKHRAIALTLALAFAAIAPASTLAKGASEHCVVFPPGGELDLNEYFGLSDRITLPPECSEVETGEHWRPEAAWIVNTTFEETPAGFIPAGATPLDDFQAKFLGVRYVVDPGTRRERVYEFANTDDLFVDPQTPGFELPLVSTITLGRLHPLSRGQHSYDVYWRFSSMHCDGFGADPAANCFPAGESLYGTYVINVVTP